MALNHAVYMPSTSAAEWPLFDRPAHRHVRAHHLARDRGDVLGVVDVEQWAGAIEIVGARKIGDNKDSGEKPDPCPWYEDGECDGDVCAPDSDGDDARCVRANDGAPADSAGAPADAAVVEIDGLKSLTKAWHVGCSIDRRCHTTTTETGAAAPSARP